MILLVDNYDSFSFNLVQAVGELVDGKEELKVIRNDEMASDEILSLSPSHIVLSPGPSGDLRGARRQDNIRARAYARKAEQSEGRHEMPDIQGAFKGA